MKYPSILALVSLFTVIPYAFGTEALVGMSIDKKVIDKLTTTAAQGFMKTMVEGFPLPDVISPQISLTSIWCSFNGDKVAATTDLD